MISARRPYKGLWMLSLAFALLWIVSALIRPAPSEEAVARFGAPYLAESRQRSKLAYLSSGTSALLTLGTVYLVSRRSLRGPMFSRFARRELSPRNALALGAALGIWAAGILGAVRFPFGLFGFYLDKGYGLSHMSLAHFLGSYCQSVAISAFEYGIAASFAAWVMTRFPRAWRLVLTAGLIVGSFIGSAIYPIVVAPMFHAVTPVEEGPVFEDVVEIASKAGMAVDKVFILEASATTSRANAYFAGIGPTKQVTLYDNLLSTHSPGEVRAVIAHELGHWKEGHLVKGILFSSFGAFLILCLWSLGDGAKSRSYLETRLISLFVFAFLCSYLLNPAASYLSRTFEIRADAFALEITQDRQAFAQAMANLAVQNMGDVEPPPFIWWFASTHPSTMQRIAAAGAP